MMLSERRTAVVTTRLSCRRLGWALWKTTTTKTSTTETPCPDTTPSWEGRSLETACTAGPPPSSTPRAKVTQQ